MQSSWTDTAVLPCRLIVKDFATQPAASHKDKLLQSHRVRGMLDSVQDRSLKLVSNRLCLRAHNDKYTPPLTTMLASCRSASTKTRTVLARRK